MIRFFHPALTFAMAVFACGQSTENFTFEVASVKPAIPNERPFFGPARGGPGTADPGQITWSLTTLKAMLLTAYDLKNYQVNGPGWMDTERYDVVAKVPAGATKEQVRVMWQNLLAERFGLVLHHEPKEFQVEELLVSKEGNKLKASVDDPAAAMLAGPPQRDKNGDLDRPGTVASIFPESNGSARVHSVSKAQPVSQLATTLSNVLGHPVIDKTGLTGKYDYVIDFKMTIPGFPPQGPGAGTPAPGNDASDPGPDIAAAVQGLGLKLVSGRAKLDVVVVDKVNKVPTNN